MKLPFVKRSKYEQALAERGRIEVYVPVKGPEGLGQNYAAYHDGRIGWVRRLEFKTYHDYVQFLKHDPDYNSYLKSKAKEKGLQELERGK